MTEAEIVHALNCLAELKSRRAVLDADQKKKIDKICAPFKAQIDKITKGIANDAKPLDAKIKALDEKVRAAVIEHGETVRGEEGDPALMAIYGSGRVSWDDSFLLGLAVTYPQIKKARTVGDPYVTIRKRE